MITPQTVQSIINSMDIVDVIGEFVKLKKRGSNYIGLCPFHNERTPSFTVSPTKEIYKCFSCGKTGTGIGFVMEHEKYSYPEALKWIANRYNIDVQETAPSEEQKSKIAETEALFIINQFAQKHFSNNLFHQEEGKLVGLSYLTSRGFTTETIEKFMLGYALRSSKDLIHHAQQAKYDMVYLTKSGLINAGIHPPVDNYRGRIIFPIQNNTGRIVGFGARVIDNTTNAPKYINTPENELYSKRRILYGWFFARQAIDKLQECLLVEGYTDVISLHQAGISNVVASGGTALTIEQLQIIKKITPHLTILYDGDAAGINAALRGIDVAIEQGLRVQLVRLPDQEDPDSFIQKHGAVFFKQYLIEHKKDYVLFQLEVLIAEAGSNTLKKSEAVVHIAKTLSKFNHEEDFLLVQQYIKQCCAALSIQEQGLITLVNKFRRDAINKPNPQQQIEISSSQEQTSEIISTALVSDDEPQEKHLVKLILEHGPKKWNDTHTIASFIFEEIQHYPLEKKSLDHLVKTYQQLVEAGSTPDFKLFLYHPDSAIRDATLSIVEPVAEISNNWEKWVPGSTHQNTLEDDVSKTLTYYKLKKINKACLQNEADFKQAQSNAERDFLIEVQLALKAEEQRVTAWLGTVIVR